MTSPSRGTIELILYAPQKGKPRQQVDAVLVVPGFGIKGDAYAGPGERQLLLFSRDARTKVDRAEKSGLCYARFSENLLVAGLDPGALKPGDRLRVGEATLKITKASKKCYPECELSADQCHIRGHVAFCEVERGGTISQGDSVGLLP
jgi:MOSC domain-containing protein YiiM